MKVKAYVNGIPCTIYHFTKASDERGNVFEYCACKFAAFPRTVPVLSELVELRLE